MGTQDILFSKLNSRSKYSSASRSFIVLRRLFSLDLKFYNLPLTYSIRTKASAVLYAFVWLWAMLGHCSFIRWSTDYPLRIETSIFERILLNFFEPYIFMPHDSLYSILVIIWAVYQIAKLLALAFCLVINSWEWNTTVLQKNKILSSFAYGEEDMTEKTGQFLLERDNEKSKMEIKKKKLMVSIQSAIVVIKYMSLLDMTVFAIPVFKLSLYAIVYLPLEIKICGILNLAFMTATLAISSLLATPFNFNSICGLFDRKSPLLFLRSVVVLFLSCLWIIEQKYTSSNIIKVVMNVSVTVTSVILAFTLVSYLTFAEEPIVHRAITSSIGLIVLTSILGMINIMSGKGEQKGLELLFVLLWPVSIIILDSLYKQNVQSLLLSKLSSLRSTPDIILYIRLFYQRFNRKTISDNPVHPEEIPLQLINHDQRCLSSLCLCRMLKYQAPKNIHPHLIASTCKYFEEVTLAHIAPTVQIASFDIRLAIKRDDAFKAELTAHLMRTWSDSEHQIVKAASDGPLTSTYNIALLTSKARLDMFVWHLYNQTLSSLKEKEKCLQLELSLIAFLLEDNLYPQVARSRLHTKYKSSLKDTVDSSWINRIIFNNYKLLANESITTSINRNRMKNFTAKGSTKTRSGKDKAQISYLSVLDYHNSLAEVSIRLRLVAQSKIQYYTYLLASPINYQSIRDLAISIYKGTEESRVTLQSLYNQHRYSLPLLYQVCMFERAVMEHRHLPRRLKTLIRELNFYKREHDNNLKQKKVERYELSKEDSDTNHMNVNKSIYNDQNGIIFVRPEQGVVRIQFASTRVYSIFSIAETEDIVGMDLNALISDKICPDHNALVIDYTLGRGSFRKEGIRTAGKGFEKIASSSSSESVLIPLIVFPQLEVRLEGGIHVGALIQRRMTSNVTVYSTSVGSLMGTSRLVAI